MVGRSQEEAAEIPEESLGLVTESITQIHSSSYLMISDRCTVGHETVSLH